VLIDRSRESARPPTINGLILSTKPVPMPCPGIGYRTHEVICRSGTIHIEWPSTAASATS
jgi:hypothetical protein